ncbi:hypothetical protein D3C80_1783770 [compost metagenome]
MSSFVAVLFDLRTRVSLLDECLTASLFSHRTVVLLRESVHSIHENLTTARSRLFIIFLRVKILHFHAQVIKIGRRIVITIVNGLHIPAFGLIVTLRHSITFFVEYAKKSLGWSVVFQSSLSIPVGG